MDEYLFISMAKLGADRSKANRERQQAAATQPVVRPKAATKLTEGRVRAIAPSDIASRLATFSLLFAGALAAIGIGGGIAAALEKVPGGQVTISEVGEVGEVDATAPAAAELKVAQAQ
jgi:hypothetical protein